jgi:NitT/TauT family transport system substrate-binding protein
MSRLGNRLFNLRALRLVFYLLLLGALGVCVGAAELPAPERLNFGYSAAGAVSTAPLWITQHTGAFKKYGLDLKPIYMAGGLAPVAVMAGEVQFAIMSSGVMIPPVLRGADLVMIASLSNFINQALVVAPETTDGKQLRGKRVSIQRLGDLTHIAAREAVKQLGLAEADVQYQQIGGVPARFAALQSGQVQGAVLSPPYIGRARRLGYRVLVNLSDLRIPFAGSSIVTTRQLVAARRPVALNLLKAFAEGIHFYKREREASIAIVERYIPGASKDEIGEAVDHYNRDLDERPYPRPEGIKTALDLFAQQTPAAKGADPERFIDQSLLRELERSGFFTALTSGGR